MPKNYVKKGGQGGARKGAGNPKGSKAKHTLEAQEVRQYLIRKVLSEAKGKKEKIKIIDKLIELAERGNMTAIKEVLDRVLGKESQPIDLQSKELKELADSLKALAKK